MPEDPSNSASEAGVTLHSERVSKAVNDALELAAYAVESGAQSADGDELPLEVVNAIQSTAAKLGALDPRGGARSVTTIEWNDFERAYYRLATFMSPVTAETLRDTEGTSRTVRPSDGYQDTWHVVLGAARQVRYALLGFSPAQRFTRGLWLVAIGFALFVVWAEWTTYNLGQATEVTDKIKSNKQLIESLVPWAYGGLGSCAYLLRSAHTFIYLRCFDLRRKPEYFNRILLGAISGGAIILFTKYLVNDEGAMVELSSGALGFIAGYSTDFLFNTIERIVTAIFPRVPPAETPDTPTGAARKRARKAAGRAKPAAAPENAESDGQQQGEKRPRRRRQSPAEGGEAAAAGGGEDTPAGGDPANKP